MLELCAGTLEQFIKEAYKGPEFSPDKIDLYQIACGVHYIHSKKLVNRDIKPENTWLKTHFPYRSGDESFRFWDEQVRNSRGSQVRIPSVDSKGHRLRLDGSKVSIAMVISEEEIAQRASVKSDIFSTGCVFFFFVTGGIHPFGKSLRIMTNILDDKKIVNLKGGKILCK